MLGFWVGNNICSLVGPKGGRRGTNSLSYWRTEQIGAPRLFSSLSFTNRKRKYVEEKTTATLKIKQTSIAKVRNHILTVACFPTPLSFQYPLPFRSPRIDSKESTPPAYVASGLLVSCPYRLFKNSSVTIRHRMYRPRTFFLGAYVPWTLHPLDNASLRGYSFGRCIP